MDMRTFTTSMVRLGREPVCDSNLPNQPTDDYKFPNEPEDNTMIKNELKTKILKTAAFYATEIKSKNFKPYKGEQKTKFE